MDWITTFLGATRTRILTLLRRSSATIGEMAEAVGITGNAVRGHVAALERDGLVREAGSAASTGGKPAQLYDLTSEGEELFPKAYVFLLRELVGALHDRDGPEATRALLAEIGRRAAGEQDHDAQPEARIESAAEALRALGAAVQVEPLEGAWEIRGYGCPLSAVVKEEPIICTAARELVASRVGCPTEELCDRTSDRPRCRFRIVTDG